MLNRIIEFSIHNKVVILLFTALLTGFGIYSMLNVSVGAVPDITTNQVQVITTSRNLSTQDVEQFLTYPVELEMANLPNVQEIRSISQFGLSVVTIVFDDHVGTYLPRQLIAEKIKSAEEQIPEGFGAPFMGPISTGLGEIYQYTLEVDSAYKDQYSLTDLRTIQDWIVKRQLSGIPGIVEVNTWGGYLKQYEVAINPERLRALQIPVTEIYDALEKNNSIAGGGYIEKNNESYFIRGEGLAGSLEDIENIVVTIRDGQPVFVRDVAKVGLGHANRFGAITGNAEGEKVLGQLMLLKDADVKKVIARVVDRVESIQSSLPDGIRINAFLERTELIDKTTFTIAENLILGFLIVVFVVVILMGSLRSGLIVGSVIPLSLLFALSIMYLFGIDANLMSLGAIDFGIIIDGAVIIVEYIAFQITKKGSMLGSLSMKDRKSAIDKITFSGTSKMMRSAIFGQVSVIIVFIPIFSLIGVEGKMFRPMAAVFSLILVGTMILCFTYVPVMASLFLKPDIKKNNFSHRLMRGLERIYHPVIVWSLRAKWLVLTLAVGIIALTGFIFSKMGGEFIPTLDEGDLVIQPVLKTGTSLSKTIEISTQIEEILLTFPEVEQVVTRIGAAEVPTDPMPMEETDVIVKLKPIRTWKTASTKDNLIDSFEAALSVLPGIDYEFTQPIEMRFNELITGVRADLAIKIFGDDLDILHQKAIEIEKAIQDVEGASDIIAEKTVGLPQMSVQFDRAKIARYGVNIAQLNDILTMAFAGKSAGVIFEGERRFDLVVRLDQDFRKDLSDLEKTSVQLPDGSAVPFTEFATIQYSKGPAMISRDDTRRRIVVGVNVRNRDLESVVKDVQDIISRDIEMPAGYTVEYGGQFENLRSARERLTYVIPVALILIFFLLYFAFHSVRSALLIYTAIPLSVVGGVMLLYFRGMPFSISASIGFIALFGVAVLNGLVLIQQFKDLKDQGMTNIHRRIIVGTKQRMRPVLLTATTTALGFLPMAVSTSAGAEVQRPLATVVIGGMISATILTLLVLPVLYALAEKWAERRSRRYLPIAIILLMMGTTIGLTAQNAPSPITLDEAISMTLENNKGILASTEEINANLLREGTAFDPDKTHIRYKYDQNNLAENGLLVHEWGIRQSIEFPTVYRARREVLEMKTALSRDMLALHQERLKKEVSQAFFNVIYWQKKTAYYQDVDSLYARFSQAAGRRYETGETNHLEKATAENKYQEVHTMLSRSQASYERAVTLLNKWIQSESPVIPGPQELSPLPVIPLDSLNHPGLQYYAHQVEHEERQIHYEKQRRLPDLNLEVLQGVHVGEGPGPFWGVEAGIGVPIFYGAQKSRIEAARTEKVISQLKSDYYRETLVKEYQAILQQLDNLIQGIHYYQNTGQAYAKEIMASTQASFQSGQIDFLQYIQLMESARTIELNFLEDIYQYNLTVLEANYLLN